MWTPGTCRWCPVGIARPRPYTSGMSAEPSPVAEAPSGWFNRTVIGAGVTSFLGDAGYEMATAVLPGFLIALGLPPDAAARAVGIIEGVADLLANAVKLAVGWYSDRIGHRKPF